MGEGEGETESQSPLLPNKVVNQKFDVSMFERLGFMFD